MSVLCFPLVNHQYLLFLVYLFRLYWRSDKQTYLLALVLLSLLVLSRVVPPDEIGPVVLVLVLSLGPLLSVAALAAIAVVLLPVFAGLLL